MTVFRYQSGEVVCEGDAVVVEGKRAVVDRVISKHTRLAKGFSCFKTGGILLKFEDGDAQLWPFTDEDLEFVRRAEMKR